MFKAPENWVKYNAAMVEYKSKVKLAANASASLDILVRAAGRGHRLRQPTKRFACEMVRVCLLGLGVACLYCFCMRGTHNGASVPKCAQVGPWAQVCPKVPTCSRIKGYARPVSVRVAVETCLYCFCMRGGRVFARRPKCAQVCPRVPTCAQVGPWAHVCPRVHQ